MRQARFLRIDRQRPPPELIAKAATVLRAGGVIAYLTDTLYGLGADAFNAAAVQRVFDVKSRPQEKALPVIIGHLNALPTVAKEIPAAAKTLIDHFWPGPLSLIMPASPSLPELLHGSSGKVAVRWPACEAAQALAIAAGGALTATSANRSGAPPAQEADEVLRSLGGQIDLIIDSGAAVETRPSTMLDITVSPPRLTREGAIPFAMLDAVIKIQR
jgi:L-threonylcarbamoyladenylate synthase